uniref:Uncharacterized protein n=1 Tax=Candidozyma auris TaxID=498019 RepID=A0A0L0NX67_CANAR
MKKREVEYWLEGESRQEVNQFASRKKIHAETDLEDYAGVVIFSRL